MWIVTKCSEKLKEVFLFQLAKYQPKTKSSKRRAKTSKSLFKKGYSKSKKITESIIKSTKMLKLKLTKFYIMSEILRSKVALEMLGAKSSKMLAKIIKSLVKNG